MADLGQILLLPPPYAGRNNLVRPGAGRSPADSNEDQALVTTQRVDSADDSLRRAKNFRFRVFDGGRSDNLAGNAEVPARTDPNAGTGSESVRGQAAGQAAIATRPQTGGSGNLPFGTPSAPFLAQLIAQEQLSAGLHDPPVKAADRAYRQAGGEPALADESRTAPRLKIAV